MVQPHLAQRTLRRNGAESFVPEQNLCLGKSSFHAFAEILCFDTSVPFGAVQIFRIAQNDCLCLVLFHQFCQSTHTFLKFHGIFPADNLHALCRPAEGVADRHTNGFVTKIQT